MRLVVLTYRLTKIKGMLVSVGICALTNATLFMGFISGGAAASLALTTAAQAQISGCNNAGATGLIESTTGSSLYWTAPANCTVDFGATIAMTNSTALASSGSQLPHGTLTNNGWIHSTLTGTALNNATIAGFSNVVNVGVIENIAAGVISDGTIMETIAAGTITGDYIGNLNGTLSSSFAVYGINNQANGTVGTLQNDGLIQASINSNINDSVVSNGIIVALSNDGSIGSLNNTGAITAGLFGSISGDNFFTVVGVSSSGAIGSLNNSGFIGADIGILNGGVASIDGPFGLGTSSATMGTLVNTGVVSGTYIGIANAGTIQNLTNSGLIQGGFAGIAAGQGSSIGVLDNSGTIENYGGGLAALVLLGSVSSLQNSAFIGSGGEGSAPVGIFNGGVIDNLNNSISGTIGGWATGIVNDGGTIANITNSGMILGGEGAGIANVYGSFDSSIGTYGSIGTLSNTGTISGGNLGIYNSGTIGVLSNQGDGTLGGLIQGGSYGLANDNSIGTFTNSAGAALVGGDVGLQNNGVISGVSNSGLITGQYTGIYNDGSIGAITNNIGGLIAATATGPVGNTGLYNRGQIGALTNNGIIAGDGWGGAGIANQGGSIGTLANGGWITGGQYGIANTGGEGGAYLYALSNTGSITGGNTGIYNDGYSTIVSLANSGSISGGTHGILNSGEIDSLTNIGLIQGINSGSDGINNEGSIGLLWNQSGTGTVTGTIEGYQVGIFNGGTISTASNNGVITGGYTGIDNEASIGTLSNSGSISGADIGVLNGGVVGTLWNQGGTISGYYALENYGSIGTLQNDGGIYGDRSGIWNNGGATIGSLNNTGYIEAEYAVDNYGQIGTLTNSGQINGYAGIYNGSTESIGVGTIGILSNSGTISGEYGIENYGLISTLTSGGRITGTATAVFNGSSATIGTLANSGSIIGGDIGVDNYGSITNLTNSGLISGEAVGIYSNGSIGSLSNTGLITGGALYGSIGTIGPETYGIWNAGTIGSIYNNGVITGGNVGGSVTSLGIYNEGLITELGNDRHGTITGTTAIGNSGTIGTLGNAGVIIGSNIGIDNYATIGTIMNLGNTGLIEGNTAINNESSGTIAFLGNSGILSGRSTGINNFGTMGTVVNTGQITGGYTGIWNSGALTSINNQGVISGESYDGIANVYTGSIGSLVNSGTISGGGVTGIGVYNAGIISVLTNSGRIAGASAGIYNRGDGIIDTLTNSGTIQGTGTIGNGVYNAGSITSLGNSGLIEGVTAGVYNDEAAVDPGVMPQGQPQLPDRPADIATLTNTSTGRITGGATGVYNAGLIGSLINAGAITGGLFGLNNQASGAITSLNNIGTIGNDDGTGVMNSGSIGTLMSSGLISGVYGLDNSGVIGSVDNSGTITATVNHAIYNTGTIGTLTNEGLLNGRNTGAYNDHSGLITSFANAGTIQGGALGVANSGTIVSLTNSGTLSGTTRAGIQNAGSIGTMTSSGVITGGAFGLANASGIIGSLDNSGTISATQHDGVYTDGTIGAMTNEGVISGAVHAVNVDASGTIGSLSNSGLISGPIAIIVAPSGSLGTVTNSGTIAGSIVNASSDVLAIAGGTGEVFGTLTGYGGGMTAADIGQITNTASNVLFSAGNVLLNDHVNVGSGTVTNSATLEVDNHIDITGKYLQTTAGTLAVGVAGVANHGELEVSSAATVNADGHVQLTGLDGFRFAAGEQFTLIEAKSASYEVDSLTAAASGFYGKYAISDVVVDGQQDLVVCLINGVTPNCNGKPNYTLANTSNAVSANNAAGGYTGSNAGLNKLADALTALGTTAAANHAGNQLLAAPHHDAVSLAEQPALDVLNVVTGHADVTRLAANGEASGVSAGESGTGLATWGEAFGGGAHQSEDGQFSGYSISSQGLVAGGDAAVGQSNARLGAVFTYTHADLKDHGDRTGDSMGLDSYGVLGYATFLGERAYADLTGGVMFDQFNTVRVIDFPGFFGIATGNHDGTQYVAKADGGYRLPMSSMTTLTPVWGVSYSHLSQDAYTENGGSGAALHVDKDGDNSVRGEAGLKLEHAFKVTRGDVVPELKVLFRHEFESGTQFQYASFATDPAGTAFSTQNVRPVLNTGVLSAGVNLLGNDGVTVSLRYGAEVGSGYVSQGGSVRVRWTF